MNLVYDRTAQDVETARTQRGTTLTPLKGCYNITDLNRVEAAVKTLAAALTAAGYPVEVTPVLKGGSRLPRGYTQLEYIESSGTQYIDTGIPAKDITDSFIDFRFVSVGTAELEVMASYVDGNNRLQCGWGGSAFITGKGATYSQTVDSTARTTATCVPVGSPASTVYLFAQNESNAPKWQCNAEIYSCNISTAVGKVRDFIPCKNPAGTVGLYDLVGGEFYTTPTAVTLPAGYTQIEYLQSSGTQHIDTGFKPNNNSKIVTTLQYVSSSSGNKFCLGARTSNNVGRFSLGYSFGSGGGWFFGHGASVTTVNTTSSPTDKTSVVIDKNVCTIAGQSATATPSTFSTTQNLVLFADNEGGKVGQNGAIKLYDCSIYDNGTLVRNFVPARNSSGTLGLYDTVNGTFYTNAGSGTFTAGADIVGFTAGAEVGKAEDREWQEGDVLYRPLTTRSRKPASFPRRRTN